MLKEAETEETRIFLSHFYHWCHLDLWGLGPPGYVSDTCDGTLLKSVTSLRCSSLRHCAPGNTAPFEEMASR